MLVAAAGRRRSRPGPAAEDELGNWLIYNGTLRFSDRWTLFTEAQLRLFEVASNLNETLVRAGGQYDLTPKALVALGVLRADTWDYGGPGDGSRVAEENRIYGTVHRQARDRARGLRASLPGRVALDRPRRDERQVDPVSLPPAGHDSA